MLKLKSSPHPLSLEEQEVEYLLANQMEGKLWKQVFGKKHKQRWVGEAVAVAVCDAICAHLLVKTADWRRERTRRPRRPDHHERMGLGR